MKQLPYILGAILLACSSLSQAQSKQRLTIPLVDMHSFSTKKAYKSSANRNSNFSIWERIEHDCPSHIDAQALEAYKDVAKFSQGNLAALVKGNVSLSHQMIAPTEGQFLQNPSFPLGQRARHIACLTGIEYSEAQLLENNIDYFRDAVQHIRFLQEEVKYPYYWNGRQFQATLITSPDEIEEVMHNPTKIGLVVSLSGAHVLGDYIYIQSGLTKGSEYRRVVLENIERFKGVRPLEANTDSYLGTPIFSINLGNYFHDGITGKAHQLSSTQERIYGKQKSMHQGITPLGMDVIKALIDNSKGGRRILIDVSNMSLAARKTYYSYLHDLRYMNPDDIIPILATNVGISDASWTHESYTDNFDKINHQDKALNNRQANLSKEDLRHILESEGFISIALDKDRLMGERFKQRYGATKKGSADRRDVTIEAIAANICQVIFTLQDPKAWDMIAISSAYDGLTHSFELYDSAEEFSDLSQDLYEFFLQPRDIPGSFTADQIRSFMYDYDAKELVTKLMKDNSIEFLKKHLQPTQRQAINTAGKE